MEEKDSNWWINKGNELGFIKKYEEALDAFKKALAIEPENAEAWVG